MKFAKLIMFCIVWMGCNDPKVSDYLKEKFDPSKAYQFQGHFHKVKIWRISPMTNIALLANADSSTLLNSKLKDSLSTENPGILDRKGQYFLLQFEALDSTGSGLLPGMKPDVETQLIPNGNYIEQLHYFLSGMKEHIWFECDGQEVHLDFYQYDRSYGVTDYRQINFGSEKAGKDCKLVLDEIFPGTGLKKIKVKDIED